MSYDIYLEDPVTGTTAEVPGHLMRGGTYKADYHPERGTFTPALNTEAHLNITYNYGRYYSEIYKEEGIRTILDKKYKKKGEWITTKRSKIIYYDKAGKEIDIIETIMHKITPAKKEEIEFEVSESDTSDYWLDMAANAIRPLYQLIALAKMRPECIWDGD